MVEVTGRTGPTKAGGYTWTVSFKGDGTAQEAIVGGDLDERVADTSGSTPMSGINVAVEVDELEKGNQLTGTFRIRYDGHSTGEMPFDSSAEQVESQLNLLPSIHPSEVSVEVSDCLHNCQVKSYMWTITFLSNSYDTTADEMETWPSGFSKVWGENVGNIAQIECLDSSLLTSRGDGSQSCTEDTTTQGTDPLGGTFTIELDSTNVITTDGLASALSNQAIVSSGNIKHNALPSAADTNSDGTSMEEVLEAMDNIGNVSVS